MSRHLALLLKLLGTLGVSNRARAGMPAPVQLTEMTVLRLQSISFFLAGFFLSAFLIQRLWNYLGREWKFLPRLGYGRALGVTFVWGLLFVLVLTMISGARELMTPAAWEKDGRTYKLAKDALPTETGPTEAGRRRSLDDLRFALWDYAPLHSGHFPASRDDTDIEADLWKVPHPSGIRYLYVGGRKRTGPSLPLAWEPDLFGGGRFVLFTNGTILKLTNDEIETWLKEGKP